MASHRRKRSQGKGSRRETRAASELAPETLAFFANWIRARKSEPRSRYWNWAAAGELFRREMVSAEELAAAMLPRPKWVLRERAKERAARRAYHRLEEFV